MVLLVQLQRQVQEIKKIVRELTQALKLYALTYSFFYLKTAYAFKPKTKVQLCCGQCK